MWNISNWTWRWNNGRNFLKFKSTNSRRKYQKKMKKKLIGFLNYCIFRGKNEVYIIVMLCVGLFLM